MSAKKPLQSVGRPRSTDVDEAILDSALALFIKGGLAAATFEQIAQRAGVSRPAIYRRWSSAEEIVAHALGRLREQAEAGLSNWTERPMSEVMDWFVDHVPRQMLDPVHRGLARNVLALDADSTLKRTYAEVVLKPRRKAFSEMVHRARAAGELKEGMDPEMIQDMLSGALLHQILLEPGVQTEDELRAYIVRLLASLGLRTDGRLPRRPRR